MRIVKILLVLVIISLLSISGFTFYKSSKLDDRISTIGNKLKKVKEDNEKISSKIKDTENMENDDIEELKKWQEKRKKVMENM